ncbi:unnamed protein product [Chondrus crispus]|uniref:Pre-mRNA-splicing factor 38 n=1 Tax=Chondrus crispus TaxID=2769 RepID=R7Q9W9_CHOCR|nr:unnamed protein product [Chondrus crispus]CDF35327.1 unnamed protein product [Chondrus crispus]|eukprot:XP_005715146.1 unnamed protein product [Chondrus crispus]
MSTARKDQKLPLIWTTFPDLHSSSWCCPWQPANPFPLRLATDNMANKTDTYALHSRGTDPQNLLEPSLRHSVYLSRFWNESCFGVTLADVVPLAARLDRISAVTAPPTPFLCLLLKLLQLSPQEPEIAVFLMQNDYRYARLLGAFYVRLALPPPARTSRCWHHAAALTAQACRRGELCAAATSTSASARLVGNGRQRGCRA